MKIVTFSLQAIKFYYIMNKSIYFFVYISYDGYGNKCATGGNRNGS